MKRPSRRQLRHAFEKEKRRNLLAQPGCHEFIVVCDGLKSDFNIGKIFRSAASFGAKSIHLVGIEWFNPYPARGAVRQVPAAFFEHFSQSYDFLHQTGYTIFSLEPRSDTSLHT